MNKVNVLSSAIFAVLYAFSGQVNSITTSGYSAPVSINSSKKGKTSYISQEKKLEVLSDGLDDLHKILLSDDEKLKDDELKMLILAKDVYFATYSLFSLILKAEKIELIENDIKDSIFSFNRKYRAVGGKLARVVSLAKQKSVVPTYFESDIDFNALKELAEHSKAIYIS